MIRLILAWYAPEWEGNGNPGTGGERILTVPPSGYLEPSTTGKRFTHMYPQRFANAGDVAQFLARNHESLLKRINWQSVIYADKTLPGWLADALINSFYYFAPCSMWAQAKDPIGDWCKAEDGVFALEESPRACPHVSTLSNLGMAGPLLSFFFPECNISSMRVYRATQGENGDLAQLLGRWADPANPMAYDYQEVVVGTCYVVQAYWHWKIHGDDDFMKEFYPSAKKALEYSFSQRPDLGLTQIIAMPPYRPHTYIYNNHQIIWISVLAIYEGMREFGLDLLRKNLHISYCKWGYLWDGPNSMSGGDNGHGKLRLGLLVQLVDLDSAAALINCDVSQLAKPGGLVNRIIEAGKEREKRQSRFLPC